MRTATSSLTAAWACVVVLIAPSASCAVSTAPTVFDVTPAPAGRIVSQDDDDKDDVIPRLTVRGESQIEVPADQVEMNIGVVTEDESVDEAIAANNDKARAIIRQLTRAGLTEDEYETGRFAVNPIYSRRPRNADQDWRPTIVGFRVTNSLRIKSKKLENAGEFIQVASEAGANNIDNLQFSLSEPRTHRAAAIREAAQFAREDAEVLARASGLKIVRVLSVNLDNAWAQPLVQRGRAEMMRMDAGAAPPPISGGDVTVTASVTLVVEVTEQSLPHTGQSH